jgi:hypothetical protein
MTFLVIRWMDKGAATGSGSAGGPQAGVHGCIEIASTSVKYTFIEIYPDEQYGYNFQPGKSGSTPTNLVSKMEATGQFDASGLKATVDAVGNYYDLLVNKGGLPAERVFIVGSGSLFELLGNRENAERQSLIEQCKIDLLKAVSAQTDKKVDFLDEEREIRLMIEGCIPPSMLKADSRTLYVDVGGAKTRGGYSDQVTGIPRIVRGRGIKAYQDRVKSGLAPGDNFAQLAAGLAAAELADPLRRQVEQNRDLLEPQAVYLGGGIVWVMATCLHGTEVAADPRKVVYIRLAPEDFDEFAQRVRATPDLLEKLEPPAGMEEEPRQRLEDEIGKMRKAFKEPERLLAGAEVLKAVKEELHLKDKKEIWFFRYSDNGALFAYIAEKAHFRQ